MGAGRIELPARRLKVCRSTTDLRPRAPPARPVTPHPRLTTPGARSKSRPRTTHVAVTYGHIGHQLSGAGGCGGRALRPAATTKPVTSPPTWACQAMSGMVKLNTRLMAIRATMLEVLAAARRARMK